MENLDYKMQNAINIFNELSTSIVKSYKLKYTYHHSSEELVIIFSPHKKFVLENVNFNAHTIQIADQKTSYYTFNPNYQISHICNYIKKMKFKKIIFIGTSKGGFGALLWSSILTNKINIETKVFVFSPQTVLYPFSKNIISPSYKKLYEKFETHPSLKVCMIKYGDIRNFINNTKAQIIISYSEFCNMDNNEIKYLKDFLQDRFNTNQLFINGGGCSFIALPIPFHGSIGLFTINKSRDKWAEYFADKIYKNAEDDEDLKVALPIDKEIFINNIKNINMPHISNFIRYF